MHVDQLLDLRREGLDVGVDPRLVHRVEPLVLGGYGGPKLRDLGWELSCLDRRFELRHGSNIEQLRARNDAPRPSHLAREA
jgi:hypothetical protein